jgi:hypothetical protein
MASSAITGSLGGISDYSDANKVAFCKIAIFDPRDQTVYPRLPRIDS